MKKAVLSLALLLCGAAAAEAQVKNRWRLQWSNEKPQLYTYRSANDRYENFWYIVYTIENVKEMNGEEIVPLIFDILLYTETGKEYQNDFRKVDEAVIKEAGDQPRRAEALKYGRFYANVIDPEVEYRIIEHHARLGNRSDGIVRESIEAYKRGFTDEPPATMKGKWKKGDRLYLNPREIREARFIQPDQKLHGIAIFKNVDPRAQVYEIHVAGLADIVKIVQVTEDEWKMEYEPWTLKLRYFRAGDPFEIEKDVLLRQAKAPEYVVKKIGPVASKDTVDKLVLALVDALKREKDWKDNNAKPEDVEKARASHGFDALDGRISAMIFQVATNMNFGYDGTKDVIDNERPVWRIHEWWLANRSKLVFDETVNRFVVKEDPLPGTVVEKQ